MAKTQKLKKNKKGLSPQTKETLTLTFKSIISNQACVDGGKNAPWWIAVIFLVLSVVLPLIPVMTTASKVDGGAFLSGDNYGADVGLSATLDSYKNDDYTFVVNSNLLSFYRNGEDPFANHTVDVVQTGDGDIKYIEKVYMNQATHEYSFKLVITNARGGNLTTLVNKYDTDKYIVGGIVPFNPSETYSDTTKFYVPNFLIFAPDTCVIALYKYQTTTRAKNSGGGMNWNNTASGTELISRLTNVKSGATPIEARNQTYKNLQNLFTETYTEYKWINFRNTTLIYFGVFVGLIFFLGLMLFILTRGKRNAFNYLTFFTTQKIAWWASFTPSVLGMILAFIITQNVIGQMAFVLLVSLRIMWLSMKQLRPAQ